MTSDYDPRDLRAIAEDYQAWCRESHHDVPLWVDYILATVRDDDGEEQGDVTITQGRWRVRVQRLKSSAWVTIDANGDGLSIPFLTFTRRQFRDLCRGLGIVIE